jgi:hypothetical protein
MSSDPTFNSENQVVEDDDLEMEEIIFPVVDDPKSSHQDDRDYVDCRFKNFSSEKGTTNKSVRRIFCEDNSEPEISSDEIVAIFKYKAQPAKGRKNPLAGRDVLHISTPTGPLRIPIEQAEKFGQYLIGAARSVMKGKTNDNTEK